MPHGIFDPLTKAPSRFARKLADKIDPPQGTGGRVRGFLAGALQGAGDVASESTSPFGLATIAAPALRPLGRLAKQSPLYGVNDVIKNSRKLIDESKDLASTYERMGPEHVPIGGEKAFNAIRSSRALTEADKVKQIAEEATRFTSKKRLPIGGNDVDVVGMMQKIDMARGRR